MKRMKVMFGQRRIMILATLAILVLAAAALAASSASFTSTSANPNNTFTTGNLHHTNGSDGAAILSVPSKMKPGDVSTGTVDITNDGDLDGTFTLSQSSIVQGAGTPSFATYLQLKVTDDTAGTTIYNGPLNGLGSKSIPTVAAGTAHTYTFTVTFPNGSAGNENQYKGTTAGCTFDWTQNQ
jgi:hypothetical protein